MPSVPTWQARERQSLAANLRVEAAVGSDASVSMLTLNWPQASYARWRPLAVPGSIYLICAEEEDSDQRVVGGLRAHGGVLTSSRFSQFLEDLVACSAIEGWPGWPEGGPRGPVLLVGRWRWRRRYRLLISDQMRGVTRMIVLDRQRSTEDLALSMSSTQVAAEAANADMLNGHRVSVLIPCLDEAENLPYVLRTIPPWVHEVVVIDDHCSDDTIPVARGVMPDVVVATNNRRPGKGNALRAGMEVATGDILVQIDADCSENPAEIHAFVGALLAGADYAKGSRFIEGGGTADMPPLHRYGNWLLTMLVRVLFGGPRFTDLCYGYNAYWKRVAPLLLDADGFEIETVMNLRAVRAGLEISEVPSFEAQRVHGEGKLMTFPDGWRVLRAIVREYRARVPITAGPPPAKPPAPWVLATQNKPGLSEDQMSTTTRPARS